MKKCRGCERELDKYSIACQYCGHLLEHEQKNEDKKASPKVTERKDKGDRS